MPEQERLRSERVNIAGSVTPIYKALTEGQSGEDSPFRTMKDVFMWAACLGYRNGRRQELPPGEKTSIRREIFTETDFAILKAIALAATGQVEVLAQLGDILTIAEEYAQGGIYDIKAQLLDRGGRALWNLTDLARGGIDELVRLPQ